MMLMHNQAMLAHRKKPMLLQQNILEHATLHPKASPQSETCIDNRRRLASGLDPKTASSSSLISSSNRDLSTTSSLKEPSESEAELVGSSETPARGDSLIGLSHASPVFAHCVACPSSTSAGMRQVIPTGALCPGAQLGRRLSNLLKGSSSKVILGMRLSRPTPKAV
eukprot:CAMPEP_0169310124 /NCGR_PEP_ID=MMETSP1017-20121227/2795_1 /TAXON_ID=342587 /ORGANISM="Karlodinium micrum, Strain CCMP2283" /LENGTH=166 /DNA_ID=CAMNT_0009403731 /DNA_START=240 /DNA_END=740 /DNA_ORIENTATION=+